MSSHPSQKRTIKHERITEWAEKRHGVPARVRTTTDALRIKLPNDDPFLDPIPWKEWFAIFDEQERAFVYEEHGYTSKVVARDGKEDKDP